MTTLKKTTAVVFSALLIFALLTACGGDKVKDDVPVSDISEAMTSAIGAGDNLAVRDNNYIAHMIGLDSDSYADCIVMTNNIGTSVDEYGIFKAADSKQAKTIADTLQSYIDMAKTDSLRFSYTPEELPKVEGAKVTTVGNYVMYSILSDANRASVLTAFESILKAD